MHNQRHGGRDPSIPGKDRAEDESYPLRLGEFRRHLGELLATTEPHECQNYIRNTGLGPTDNGRARVVLHLSACWMSDGSYQTASNCTRNNVRAACSAHLAAPQLPPITNTRSATSQ